MTAPIGHNQPPCPFAPHVSAIDELIELATGTLTGDIKTQAQFDQVESLLDDVKDAAKALAETHKTEKAPWLAGGQAVQCFNLMFGLSPIDGLQNF